MACYEAKGASAAAERNLNSHDQFLQGGVALGWAGMLLTLLLAIVPLVRAWRLRNMPLLLFMVLFIVNALVESVLEVQAGVLFFAAFLGLMSARSGTLRPS
ncbi:MAG: hypothetical protein H6597_06135, partial [Flavobacteriales bacterium]|nr:hypothetical protein [Flavobacteriales bacterium]